MDLRVIIPLICGLATIESLTMSEDEQTLFTTRILYKFRAVTSTKYLESLISTPDLINTTFDTLIQRLNAEFNIKEYVPGSEKTTYKDIEAFVVTLEEIVADEKKYSYFSSTKNDSLTRYNEIDLEFKLPTTILIPMIIRVLLSIGAKIALAAEALDNLKLQARYEKIIEFKSRLMEIEMDLGKNLPRGEEMDSSSCRVDYSTTNWLIFQLSSVKDNDVELKSVIRIISDEMKKSDERAVYFENEADAFSRKDDPAIKRLRRLASAARIHEKYLERMLKKVFKLIGNVKDVVNLGIKMLDREINAIACHAYLRYEMKKCLILVEKFGDVDPGDERSIYIEKIISNWRMLVKLIKEEIKIGENRVIRVWNEMENALENTKKLQFQLRIMGVVSQIGNAVDRGGFRSKCPRIKYTIHAMETDIEQIIVRELEN